MAVSWVSDPHRVDPNRFGNKHLHVVQGIMSMPEMVSEGQRVLRERNAANTQDKKDAYGKAKPSISTLLVTNVAGQEKMESWIESNFSGDGHYHIPNQIGAIIHCEKLSGPDQVTTAGSIHVSIRERDGAKEVYHLKGADMSGGVLNEFKISRGGVAFTV